MVKRVLLTASLTGVLWVIPVVATQGMATIGARFSHPDAVLIDTRPDARLGARNELIRADGVVERAIATV